MESYFYKKELDALRDKLSASEVIKIEKQADLLFSKKESKDEAKIKEAAEKYKENKIRLFTLYYNRKISLRKNWLLLVSIIFLIILMAITPFLLENRKASSDKAMSINDSLTIYSSAILSKEYNRGIDSIKTLTNLVVDSNKIDGVTVQHLIYNTIKQDCDTVKAIISYDQFSIPSNKNKLHPYYFYLYLFIAFLIAQVILVIFLKPTLLKLCKGHFKKEYDEYQNHIKKILGEIHEKINSSTESDTLKKKLNDYYDGIQNHVNSQKYKKAIEEIKKAKEYAKNTSEIVEKLNELLEKL